MSGIAKRVQVLLNDEYLAGLWRKYLPTQLLWTVRDRRLANGLPLTRPRPYRAPSWSWASVDGKIGYYYEDYEDYGGILITVLDAGVTPVGADSTGQIKDGFIRLTGRIFLAHELVRHRPSCTFRLRVGSENLEGHYDPDTKPQALGNISFYFLPIWSVTGWNVPDIIGLILQPAAKGNGTYEGIGLCTVAGEDYSALKRSQDNKDKSLYENADGETILLI